MSMESIRIENMYDLKETIAAEIFEGKTYPWEVLPFIKEFIVALPKGEHMDFVPGSYAQIKIPKFEMDYNKDKWSVYHRKGCRGASVCIYPGQRNRR